MQAHKLRGMQACSLQARYVCTRLFCDLTWALAREMLAPNVGFIKENKAVIKPRTGSTRGNKTLDFFSPLPI